MLCVRSITLTTDVFILAALAIIGIGMVIAGIGNMRSADNPEDASAKESKTNVVSGWMLGSSAGMDPKRAGRARITIGVICIVAALLFASVRF